MNLGTSAAPRQASLRQSRDAAYRAHGELMRVVRQARVAGLLAPTANRPNFAIPTTIAMVRKAASTQEAEALRVSFESQAAAITQLLEENGGERPIPPSPSGEPSAPSRKTRLLSELSPSQLEERTQRLCVVTAMQSGCSATQALAHTGLPATGAMKRWAQRLAKEYAETGMLDDGRAGESGPRVTVLTPAMKALIEVVWLQHPHANATSIRLAVESHVASVLRRLVTGEDVSEELLVDDLEAGQVRTPSLNTIRRAIREFGPAKNRIRRDGWREYGRQMRPTCNVQWTTHANERWEIDHTPLDIWARVGEGSEMRAVVLHLTAIIDVHSRGIVAAIVSARDPDAFTTALALRMGILPKATDGWVARGKSELLVLDNGKDFRSQQVAGFCRALGIEMLFCDPHEPDQKPHIERFFGTLTRELLSHLPGYKHGADRGSAWSQSRIEQLLTVTDVRAEILRWIHEEYHARAHSATGRRPMELWLDSAIRVDVPDERELDVLLLYQQARRVSRGVVRLTPPGADRGVYWGPSIAERNGHQLTLRYNPDDLLSVYAYDAIDGSFIGELWNLHDSRSPYSDVAVRAAWMTLQAAEKTRQRGLRERVSRYHTKTAAEDRRARKRRGDDTAEARAVAAANSTAEALQTSEELRSATDAADDEVTEALSRLRRSLSA